MLRSLWPKSLDANLAIGSIALALMLMLAGWRIVQLQGQLAAKPAVESKTEVRTVTRTVAGPVRIVERFVDTPGPERIIERVTERGPVTTEKGTERAVERSETPMGERTPKRFLGVMVAHDVPTKVFGVRGGMTVFGRLDLGVGYRFAGPWIGPQAEVAFRF